MTHEVIRNCVGNVHTTITSALSKSNILNVTPSTMNRTFENCENLMSTSRTLACVCVLLVLWGNCINAEETPRNRVLIIGIDGIRRDALLQVAAPNLQGLIERGAFATNTEILGERYDKNDTISGPGWSSFLTGVWADKHGVHDNSFAGKNYQHFPHIFARVKQQFPTAQTASFVDWEPIDTHIVSAADIRKVYPARGAAGYTEKDREITRDAAKLLREGDPHLVFTYLGAVDETGHKFGFHPSVNEYMESIRTVDAHVGTLLQAMKSRENYAHENWLVLVSTDHGGVGLGHGSGHQQPEIRNTFLIVSGSNVVPGIIETQTYLVDLPVTALVHLGVIIDPAWQLDGRAVGLKE